MSHSRLLRLGRLVVLCVVVVGIVAWRWAGDEPGSEVAGPDVGGVTSDATTTTTAPSPFGPVAARGTGAVESSGGVLLPVTGGMPGAWEVLTPCGRPAVVDGAPVTGAHVLIDPGHGGNDPGAVAPDGAIEAEINLDVARRTAALLREAGATVLLTRDSEAGIALAVRGDIARAVAPDLFLSIHHNGGPTVPSDRPGTELFHQHDSPDASRLAGLLWDELAQAFAPLSEVWSAGHYTGINVRLLADGTDYYAVLRQSSPVPAVLIEALYMTAEPEYHLLTSAEIRQAEAEAIAAAVTRWFTTTDHGSATTRTIPSSGVAQTFTPSPRCEDPDLP